MSHSRSIFVFALLAALLLPGVAFAQDDVAPAETDGEAPVAAAAPAAPPNPLTDAGSFEIGIDQILVLNFSETDVQSETDFVWIGGIQPKIFIMDNWSISASLNVAAREISATTTVGDVETTSEASDTTFLGFLMTHYYVPMGDTIFFKPGIGFGAFFGARERPGGAGMTADSSLLGFAMRVDVGFAFHFNDHVNLKLGFDLLPQFGSETPDVDGAESESFTQIDAGFNAGVGIMF